MGAYQLDVWELGERRVVEDGGGPVERDGAREIFGRDAEVLGDRIGHCAQVDLRRLLTRTGRERECDLGPQASVVRKKHIGAGDEEVGFLQRVHGREQHATLSRTVVVVRKDQDAGDRGGLWAGTRARGLDLLRFWLWRRGRRRGLQWTVRADEWRVVVLVAALLLLLPLGALGALALLAGDLARRDGREAQAGRAHGALAGCPGFDHEAGHPDARGLLRLVVGDVGGLELDKVPHGLASAQQRRLLRGRPARRLGLGWRGWGLLLVVAREVNVVDWGWGAEFGGGERHGWRGFCFSGFRYKWKSDFLSVYGHKNVFCVVSKIEHSYFLFFCFKFIILILVGGPRGPTPAPPASARRGARGAILGGHHGGLLALLAFWGRAPPHPGSFVWPGPFPIPPDEPPLHKGTGGTCVWALAQLE